METKDASEGIQKLVALREQMKLKKYDAYIVPHSDSHDNEYISDPDKRIEFISNFSGSNAICLITQDSALLWTDGRYYIQAEKELYPGWEMRKMERGEQDLKTYIKNTLPPGSYVGIDLTLFSHADYNCMKNFLKDYSFVDDEDNIVNKIWPNRPDYSTEKVIVHEIKFAGETPIDKYKRVKVTLGGKVEIPENGICLLISRLDNIAWLTNLRGRDISYNPVFFAYAMLYMKGEEIFLHMFANQAKFDSPEVSQHLAFANITLFNADAIYQRISQPETQYENYKLILDSESINERLINHIQHFKKIEEYQIINEDVIELTKGKKTEREIQGYRDSNLRDSTALVRYFAWLENELIVNNKTDITEYQAAVQSAKFRAEQEYFMGESFAPISSIGSNAAIIHYEPKEKECSLMDKNKIYLCDTGGQYLDGTTDTTRTLHFTNPTTKEKEMYTRVLLGNLSLERSFIPKRWCYRMRDIDALARQYLWQVQCEYLHGTSHGVGYFLNVHEGPHGTLIEPGLVFTNEPGYYLKDNFGIRIENMLVSHESGENKDLICFENITLVPYETSLIDFSLLSDDFINYINLYHKKVYEKISPLIRTDPLAMDYLARKTNPLKRPEAEPTAETL